MVTFSLQAGSFVATVVTDEPAHPDLLDELGRRCVRLFVEANATLPEGDEGEVDD